MSKYFILAGTEILIHKKGTGFDLEANFQTKVTEKGVYYKDKDLWFSATPSYSDRHDPYSLWLANTDDNIALIKSNMYGFVLPDNKMNVDYILVPTSNVRVIDDDASVISADPRKTSAFKDKAIINRVKRRLNLL